MAQATGPLDTASSPSVEDGPEQDWEVQPEFDAAPPDLPLDEPIPFEETPDDPTAPREDPETGSSALLERPSADVLAQCLASGAQYCLEVIEDHGAVGADQDAEMPSAARSRTAAEENACAGSSVPSFAESRRSLCKVSHIMLRTRLTTGAVTTVSRVRIVEHYYTYPIGASTRVDYHLTATVTSQAGLPEAYRLNGQVFCTRLPSQLLRPCNTLRFPGQTLGIGSPVNVQKRFTVDVPDPVSPVSVRSQSKLQFSNPGALPFRQTYKTSPSLKIRCDRIHGNTRPGCVIPSFEPVHVIELSTSWGFSLRNEYTNHIESALNSGLPHRLHRTDDATRDKNRRRACRNIKKVDNRTCDEYPFATTREGAHSQPLGTGRTFDHCHITGSRLLWDFTTMPPSHTGWSSCRINAAENRAGGRDLETFYGRNRVLVGDPFRVEMGPEIWAN